MDPALLHQIHQQRHRERVLERQRRLQLELHLRICRDRCDQPMLAGSNADAYDHMLRFVREHEQEISDQIQRLLHR